MRLHANGMIVLAAVAAIVSAGFVSLSSGAPDADVPTPVQNVRPVDIEAEAVLCEGATYQATLAAFRSDLSPASRMKRLDILIQFAVRNHHAEETARLLLEETDSIPTLVLSGFPAKSQDGFLRMFLPLCNQHAAMDAAHGTYFFSADEARYWSTIVKGLIRVAAPQRGVFEQELADPKNSVQRRLFARYAVQEADLQAEITEAAQEWLSVESPTGNGETPDRLNR